MSALPPDQLQAIQAVLAQQAPAQAEQIAQSIAVTVQSSPIDTNAIARALLIDGTATQTSSLDQLLLRTGQGEFLVRIPEAARQQIQDSLPSRVTLQLRPGPNGLEAVLVVGSRAAQQADQVQQSLASNAASSRQTLTAEIPKVGQVFQITVIPNALLSNLLYNQNRATASKLVQNPAAPQTSQPTVNTTPQAFGEQAAKSAGLSVQGAPTQSASTQGTPAAAATPSNPAPVQTSQNPINKLNEGTAGSRNNYDANTTQGNAQGNAQGNTPQQVKPQLPMPTVDEKIKLPLPLSTSTRPQSGNLDAASPKLAIAVPALETPTTPTVRPQILPLRILNVATPQQEIPLPTLPNEKQLIATVRGATPSGQPILTVDDQVLVVNTPKNWPIGTKLQVTIGAGAELVIDKEVKAAPAAFENLRQILEYLGQQNPVLINEVKRFRIPLAQTGQVAGPLLFLLAAMQKGNINAWLGNDVKEALEANGKHGLLAALKNEIEGGREPAIDNMGTQWKGSNVPYLDGEQLKQFRFYVHDDPRQQKPNQNPREVARRFLIDVSLTRLGPIQIDGLVNQKKLDVIVRTQNTLPEELRNDLRFRFAHSLEEVRYTGALIFQTNKQGWVEIKSRQASTLSKNL